MAVAVQQRASRHPRERQGKHSRLRLARDELLEQQRIGGHQPRLLASEQRRDLVAEAEQAARLQADHRNSARGQRRKRGDASARPRAAPVDEPDRQESAPAAQRAAAAVGRPRQVHAVSPGGEHGQRGGDVLRLEIAVESVGEEHHRPRPLALPRADEGGSDAGPGSRQASARQRGRSRRALKPAYRSDQSPQPRMRVAQIGEPRPARRERRIARQVRRSADRAARGRALPTAPPAPRSSCAPYRRRSDIRAGRPCRRRRARASPPSHRRRALRARAGR